MIHQGDPAAGKALFLEPQKIACSQCHSLDGKGGKAGPDLFAIGDKFGRDDLIEQVLNPSATIAVGYSTTIIQTKSGQSYVGIVKQSTDQSVGIMGVDGKLLTINASDIDSQRTNDVSLMPEGLEASVTQQQFTDLIAYLASLRAPQNLAQSHHGMPLEIPPLATPLKLVPFISPEHKFEHPVWFGNVPGLKSVFAVVEHEAGNIWLIDKSSAGETKSVFLDIGRNQKGTRGLIGLVFHPQFAQNRRYFVIRHTVDGRHFASHLMEGVASQDLRSDSGQPLREVLTLPAVTNVHYGGSIQFGPDGCLYIGMGDSGPQGDPEGHAQNMSLLLGKIMRIDVDHPAPGKLYSIPADNPFLNRQGARPEIWAYGLREPWRFSFDPITGDLWVGDVGQDLYEEVDIVRKGENYGWNVYEGFERYSNKYRREGETFVPPVFAWTRKYGQSSTGGYVYRGDPKSSFYGVYVFGDYQLKHIFALTQKDRVLEKVRMLCNTPQSPVTFGRDEQGRLYMVGYEGNIYKLDLESTRFE
jgi:putative heme-binding domain-containing protein